MPRVSVNDATVSGHCCLVEVLYECSLSLILQLSTSTGKILVPILVNRKMTEGKTSTSITVKVKII